jgi:hypothetical protein
MARRYGPLIGGQGKGKFAPSVLPAALNMATAM